MLNLIFKNKIINLFFILAFTLAISTFFIANTIINNKNQELKRYDPNRNKELAIITNDEININDVQALLDDNKITLELKQFNEENKIFISTILINNSIQQRERIVEGRDFEKKEFDSKNNSALVSRTLHNKNDVFKVFDGKNEINFDVIGVFNDIEKSIIVPKEYFYDMANTSQFGKGSFRTILSGEIKDLNIAIEELEGFLKSKDSENSLEVFDFMKEDKTIEVNVFLNATIAIILITIINSISLTSLWFNNRKKELSIRKAMGATNNELRNLYFKEILILAFIALIISFLIYIVLFNLSNGYIKGYSIEFNLFAVLQALLLVTFTSFVVSIPLLFNLIYLNPSELLRED